MPTSRAEAGSAPRPASPARSWCGEQQPQQPDHDEQHRDDAERLDRQRHARRVERRRRGTAPGSPRLSKPQIQPAAALTTMNRPSVTMTRFSGLPPSTGRISTRSIEHPADERERQRAEQRASRAAAPASAQRPGDERGEHRHLALGEVDDAGRAEDQHQRERQRRVHRAVGDPVDDHLQEPLHREPPHWPRQLRADRVLVAWISPPARTARSARPPARTRRRPAPAPAPRSARPAASPCPSSARDPRAGPRTPPG